MCRRPLLLLLALAALLAAPPGCRALSCYHCSDHSQVSQSGFDHIVSKAASQPCSSFDPDNSTYKMDPCVAPHDQSCIKVTYGTGQVIRGCFNLVLDNCTAAESYTTCYCRGDFCNSAGLTTPALLLLLLPAALVVAMLSRQ